MKSVGFSLTGVFAFFVLSNLFNVLVLKDNSREAVSCPGAARQGSGPAEQAPACLPL